MRYHHQDKRILITYFYFGKFSLSFALKMHDNHDHLKPRHALIRKILTNINHSDPFYQSLWYTLSRLDL